MSYPQALDRLLILLRAQDKPHSGRTLKDHLLGTAHLLHIAGAPEHVVLAGGAHSVYGTEFFPGSTTDRRLVAGTIGVHAEVLAWAFHRLRRSTNWVQLNDSQLVTRSGLPFSELYPPVQIEQLRAIEQANLAEQS